MPASTPRLLLPYPVGADSADVPRDVKALADRVEALQEWIRGGIDIKEQSIDWSRLDPQAEAKLKEPQLYPVVALPSAPSHEDMISYCPNALETQGIAWLCQFNATIGKWIVLGGPPLSSWATGVIANLPNVWTLDANVYVNLPVAGSYLIEWGSSVACAAGQSCYTAASEVNVPPPAVPNVPADLTSFRSGLSLTTGAIPSIASAGASGPWSFLSGTVRLYHRASVNAATPSVASRWLRVRPVMLG